MNLGATQLDPTPSYYMCNKLRLDFLNDATY